MYLFNVNYNYFFSALVQSLAALIGIVGLFVVYRLQIQKNINENIFTLLKETIRVKLNLEISDLSPQQKIIDKTNKRVKNLKNEIEELKKGKLNKEKEREEEASETKRSILSNGIHSAERRIARKTKEIEETILHLKEFNKGVEDEIKLKEKSLFTIRVLSICFIYSLIGLFLGNWLNNLLTKWQGLLISLSATFLVILGLVLIYKICKISFDFENRN